MKFKGYGIVWNPKKGKRLVNFKATPEYETENIDEIEILSNCDYVTEIRGELPEAKEVSENTESILTKPQIMEELDIQEIEYNPRDKKEVLLKLLEG